MKCPVCKDPSLVMSEKKGVEIDYCPDCRGVWLDRGELEKILEKAKAEDSPRGSEASFGSHGSHGSHPNPGFRQKPYKRKKSFFEELFD